MDNLTHTLFALTLARTPLSRAGRGTTAALILGSNAPDVDIVTTVQGASNYLTWHRGPTHGPLGVALLGAGVAGLVWTTQRVLDRLRPSREPVPRNASLSSLVVMAALGVLLHILMDLPTSYGTRLLSPFDWHWFTTDWMPIFDPYLLIVLAAGLTFGAIAPGTKQRAAVIVLALMAANYGGRAVLHDQALTKAPQVFGPRLLQPCASGTVASGLVERWPQDSEVAAVHQPGGHCLMDLVALPTFFSPFSWRVVARLPDAYEIRDVNLLDWRFRSPPRAPDATWRTGMRVPNFWSPPVLAAAVTPLFRRFLGFSRLPVVRTTERPDGATVRLTDVRFVGPITFDPTGPRYGLFTVFVQVDSDGRILSEGLTP
jgi:membrane-bound metal-dependent hydrolase YbcI (DUF457 family)